MHVTGRYKEDYYDNHGNMYITFQIFDKSKGFDELGAIADKEKLVIDAVQYRKRRSLDANAYFWQLVDKIAKTLKADRMEIYKEQLRKYGVFVDLQIWQAALPTLEQEFRCFDVLDKDDYSYLVRCYLGSSTYDSKQMAELIDGTVEDAKELGIETLTKDELLAMIASLERKNNVT